ncbi:TPM domain-containing protein [Chitinophagaceae bacterium LWZ2-11]
MLNLFKRKAENLFSEQEKESIVKAIQAAERTTSGEVRVYIESKCSFVNPLDRAVEIFGKLNMQTTRQRNAVLLYVAMKDRQLAVFGDEGIHQKVGDVFWNKAVTEMLSHFNKNNYAEGIAGIVKQIGEALQHHFPYETKGDVNELPDDIVFGK